MPNSPLNWLKITPEKNTMPMVFFSELYLASSSATLYTKQIMALFNRFRKRQKAPEPGSIVQELWTEDFRKVKKNRFILESTSEYSGEFQKNSLVLDIKKKNCFAWIDNPVYRYKDFVLEGYINFLSPGVNNSAGFIFRKANDYNYYYFLVSSKGFFRVDQVFNGHPSTIIPWTPLHDGVKDLFFVRIVVTGNSFVFCVNNNWAAEIDSETIDAGTIAFAGQNYNDSKNTRISLNYLYIDSRPMEVEKNYARWSEYIAVPGQARLNFAKSLSSLNQQSAAAVQLKKVLAGDKENQEAVVLLAQSYLSMGMYEETVSVLSDCQISEEFIDTANLAVCNAFYLSNKYLELREYILVSVDPEKRSAIIWNHLGNAEFALGNWQESYNAYSASIKLDASLAQVHVNCGTSAQKLKRKDDAFNHFNFAAALYFRDQDYLESENLLPQLRAINPDSKEVNALEAKLDFSRGDFESAEAALYKLAEEKYDDSAVFYLCGLLCSKKGDYKSALEYYTAALDMEPGFYLYQFRYAEGLYYSGKEWHDDLQKALDSNEQDAWMFNFAGIAYGSTGQAELAEKYLLQALGLAPDAEDIRINYSWFIYEKGQVKEALAIVEEMDSPAANNHIGNIYSGEKDMDSAVKYYEKAIAQAPLNTIYLENCATVWLELDAISRAEELFIKALELQESAGLYNKIGNLSWVKGEYQRAEKAYEHALMFSPDDVDVILNLADLKVTKLQFDEAKELIEKAQKIENTPRCEELLKKIILGTEQTVECSGCDCSWTIPKNLPEQAGLNIHGAPPPEAPAGNCPECGKIYCISCGEKTLKNSRFYCPDCDVPIKLNDERVRYILREQFFPE